MTILYGLSGKLGPPSDVTPAELAAREKRAIRRFHDLWDAIHDLTDPTPEKLDRITAMIPCGDCKQHWLDMLKRKPPVYTPLSAYRYCSWEWHDETNERLGKPRPSFQDVARARNWPTPKA